MHSGNDIRNKPLQVSEMFEIAHILRVLDYIFVSAILMSTHRSLIYCAFFELFMLSSAQTGVHLLRCQSVQLKRKMWSKVLFDLGNKWVCINHLDAWSQDMAFLAGDAFCISGSPQNFLTLSTGK